MKIGQLVPCPFCGNQPTRHDSVGPSGFTWSKEEEQIFPVACMTHGCQPSGTYLPDILWNQVAGKQGSLMKAIFETMEAEHSPLLEDKKKRYRLYVISH